MGRPQLDLTLPGAGSRLAVDSQWIAMPSISRGRPHLGATITIGAPSHPSLGLYWEWGERSDLEMEMGYAISGLWGEGAGTR